MAGAPGHDRGVREPPTEQQEGREHRRADRSAHQGARERAARRDGHQDDRHGDEGPRLVGHRQADQRAGHDRPGPRGQHGGDTQRAAQELLRVAVLERRQRGGTGGEGDEHDHAVEHGRPCVRIRPATKTASPAHAARPGSETARKTASSPPPHSAGAQAKGAHSTKEPP